MIAFFLLASVLQVSALTQQPPLSNTVVNWEAPQHWTPTFARSDLSRMDMQSNLSPPLPFTAVTPCRLADTRGNGFAGAYGPPPLSANLTRTFPIQGQCGIPSTAAAVSFNFAVVNIAANGNLVVYPSGDPFPNVSVLNWQAGFLALSNAAVVALGNGAIDVFVNAAFGSTVDLVIDVNGFYGGVITAPNAVSARRGALGQWWTNQLGSASGLSSVTVGGSPSVPAADGADIWVPNNGSGTVTRVRASDGKVLETWTGATMPLAALVALGRVFVTGATSPGALYMIDPAQPAGPITQVATVGDYPIGLTFDGTRIWTANLSNSVSIVTPGGPLPWSVTTVSHPTELFSSRGAIFDGTNVWVTAGFNSPNGRLVKLGPSGLVLQVVQVGSGPGFPAFDGRNIWVPNEGYACGGGCLGTTVTVVRAATGQVVATLTVGAAPSSVAFDGERIAVSSLLDVTFFRAGDLAPLGSATLGNLPNPNQNYVCSDGINFWISLQSTGKLFRL
jgi:hypothetical protein